MNKFIVKNMSLDDSFIPDEKFEQRVEHFVEKCKDVYDCYIERVYPLLAKDKFVVTQGINFYPVIRVKYNGEFKRHCVVEVATGNIIAMKDIYGTGKIVIGNIFDDDYGMSNMNATGYKLH